MGALIDADIRLLTSADLDDALLLSSTAGWNQRLADWRMLLQLAPAGCFTAVVDRRIVGTAIGIDYGSFAWIAMMLVDPAYRGHGLGAQLLEAAMGAVPADHPVRLDATPMGRTLYQRYGFEDEATLTRHVAEAIRQPDAERPGVTSTHVRGLTSADLDAIATCDRAVFGGNRRVVLEWALEGAAEYAHVIDTDRAQYCFGRYGRLFDQIGPVVAHNDRDAQALVTASLRAAEGKAAVADVFDARSRFAEWLRARGFNAQRPLFRMCRPGMGHAPEHEFANRGNVVEYAILGPEFG